MTFDIAIMLFLLVSVIVLLAMELLPVDVTALLGLLALVATGLISPTMAFSGFATATLMPATLQIAKKTKIHPNQLLMPLAFASILGGTCTLIGTSTNLADAEIMPLELVRDRRRLMTHGNRKLQAGDKIVVKSSRDALLLVRDNPKISIEAESTLAPRDVFADEAQTCEVVLMPQSPLAGKSLKQLKFYARYQVAVLAIYRGGKAYPSQIENTLLRVKDYYHCQPHSCSPLWPWG